MNVGNARTIRRVGVIVILISPAWSTAQSPDTRQQELRASQISQVLTLPPVRPLAMPPAVPQSGTFTQVDGTAVGPPLTATAAAVDLQLHALQLTSAFPVSASRYPLDSIEAAKRTRAQAWLDRLPVNAMLEEQSARGSQGWDLVSLGEVAARAGRDTIAQRAFEARFAALKGNPAEQSYVLSRAIQSFTVATQDSSRLNRNLAIAEGYGTRLHALPAGGYRTVNDSTSVLYRLLSAERDLIVGYNAVGDIRQIGVHAERLLADGGRLHMRERGQIATILPYREVVTALVTIPQERARIPLITERYRLMGGMLAEAFVALTNLIGKPAPPINAHMVLHTSDSVYHDTPRPIPVADGKIRVFMFTEDAARSYLPIMGRVKQRFPEGVDPTIVTYTKGANPLDTLSMGDEIAWLNNSFQKAAGPNVPVALWAANKVRVDDGMVPLPSPNERLYYEGLLGQGQFVLLVDGRGIIRSVEDVSTRINEETLMRRIGALLAEVKSSSTALLLVPALPSVFAAPVTSSTH